MRFLSVLAAAACAVAIHNEVAAQSMSATDMMALQRLCQAPFAPGARDFKPPSTEQDKQKCWAFEKATETCQTLLIFGMGPHKSHGHCQGAEYRKHLPNVQGRKAQEARMRRTAGEWLTTRPASRPLEPATTS